MEMDRELDTLLERARKAAEIAAGFTQKEVDDVCLAVAWAMYKDENIKRLAEAAVDETGMGSVADKITKHKVKVLGVINDVKDKPSVGVIEDDPVKKIRKYAKPVGIVGALTPVTNPTATPASNAVSILKGRNAVIFAPHPRSKKSSGLAVELMREELKRIGAPEDLVQIIAEPSIEKTGDLMKRVDLVLATGGGAMVKAAYSSGTPAYGVGPGNAVQIVAEDADVADAAKKIALSKAFDCATSCSSENSVIIHDSVYDEFVKAMLAEGSLLMDDSQKATLKAHMWKPNKKGHMALNPAVVAVSAMQIASDAGLDLEGPFRILMVEGGESVEEDKFAGEKLSPVLTLWRYSDFDEAMDTLVRLTNAAGTGHSCGIHTFKEEYVERMALEMHTSRVLVRQPQAPGNGGNFFNGMPSTVTLGCGTWGGNITTENIYYKHFMNITWLSYPFDPVKPTDKDIWGEFWNEYRIEGTE